MEWIGWWNDNCLSWNIIDLEERERLIRWYEDGEFWMFFSDFLRYYFCLEICNLILDIFISDIYKKWKFIKMDGNWRWGFIVGGCRNYLNIFWMNF